MTEKIYNQFRDDIEEDKREDGLEFLSDIESKLRSLKAQSSQLSEIRKSAGVKGQKVLDFRTTKPSLTEVAELKMASGKIKYDLDKKKASSAKNLHKPNTALKPDQGHTGVYGMPTGKGFVSGRSSQPINEEDTRSDDGLQRMDKEKLRYIWKRMHTMSVKTVGDKISRDDFLDRIFLEEELKDFYDLLQEPIMEDFKAFYSPKLDVLYPTLQYLGYDELAEFLPKANRLHKLDAMPDARAKDLEVVKKIESKYNIELTQENNFKKRKAKTDMNKTITIPKPFSFVDKKRENKTIAQTKLEREVEEREKEIRMLNHWQFRANPVPAYCLVPMMNTLDGAREKRRQEFVSTKATKNHMKVFSFVDKEEQEKGKKTEKLLKKWEEEPHIYRAKPIPTNVSLPMYNEMVEQNKVRSRQNVQKRKAYLMKISKLPERMKRAEEDKFGRSRKRAKDDTNIDYTYVPEINPTVPNFEKLHRNFESKMESKKMAHPELKVQEFNMTIREKQNMARSASVAGVVPSDARFSHKPNVDFRKSLQNMEKAKAAAETVNVKSTMKAEGIKKLNQKAAELKEFKDKQEQKKEALKQERYNGLKSDFQERMKVYRQEEEVRIREKMGDSLITVDTIKDNIRHRQNELKLNEEKYYDELKGINERVNARDLLIANYDEKNNKRKMRAKLLLQQYNDMVKNGFANPAKFLTKEELMLIEEERLRQDMLDEKQLRALMKNKRDRLDNLRSGRNLKDEERREMQRLEMDLKVIEDKLREKRMN